MFYHIETQYQGFRGSKCVIHQDLELGWMLRTLDFLRRDINPFIKLIGENASKGFVTCCFFHLNMWLYVFSLVCYVLFLSFVSVALCCDCSCSFCVFVWNI